MAISKNATDDATLGADGGTVNCRSLSAGNKDNHGGYFFGCFETLQERGGPHGGKELFFPRKEFELLYYLATHQGRVFSRDTLLNQIWGEGAYVVERTVDVHIFKVREKLGKMGDRIETVKGVGYRFAN